MSPCTIRRQRLGLRHAPLLDRWCRRLAPLSLDPNSLLAVAATDVPQRPAIDTFELHMSLNCNSVRAARTAPSAFHYDLAITTDFNTKEIDP